MRTAVIIAIVALLLVGFVFVWVNLAAQGVVPSIQAPLESLNPWLRVLILLVLTGILFLVYQRVRKST